MHRVILINPPSAPGTLANREGAAGLGVVYPHPDAFFYPPHTLAAVAASLRDAGYQVEACDAVVEELVLDLRRADVIGVFISYASLDADMAFLARLRGWTSAKVVVLGPAMRFLGREVLSRAPVDAVLVGEAEGFFVETLHQLAGQASTSTQQVFTPMSVGALGYDAEGFLQSLEGLPFPAWDVLPHKRYPLLTILGSRGCPDHCAYCPYAAAQGHRFRARSVENVLAELEYLHERFCPSRLIFRDPVFAHDRDRVLGICDGILRRGLKLRWECESRPEHFDDELLQLMKRAGCRWVKIGLETTDEALLINLRRVASIDEARTYLDHVAAIVRACRRVELPCRLFAMAGLPGQGVAMAKDTAQFVEQLRPSALNVKLCEMYPGTDLSGSAECDHGAQLQILLEAQLAVRAAQTSPGLLVRGRRWLRRIVSGEKHG
jgi:radical SAM superfamily enzyme YgiQ (UPF0313 family)